MTYQIYHTLNVFEVWLQWDIKEFYIFPIMLALCLMLSVTHYAQNYAGIIGKSLLSDMTVFIFSDVINILLADYI